MSRLSRIYHLCLLLLSFTYVFSQNVIEEIKLSVVGKPITYKSDQINLAFEAKNTKGKRKYNNSYTLSNNSSWGRYNTYVEGPANFKWGVLNIDRSSFFGSDNKIQLVISPKNNPSVSDTLVIPFPNIIDILTTDISGKYSIYSKVDISDKIKLVFDSGDTVRYDHLDKLNQNMLLFNSSYAENGLVHLIKPSSKPSPYGEISVSSISNLSLFKTLKVAYDFEQDIQFNGNGRNGRNGRDGQGVVESTGSPKDGLNGMHGEDGSHGEDASDVHIYLQSVYLKDSIELLQIRIVKLNTRSEEYLYLNPNKAILYLNVNGGNGGRGGDGVSGTNGQNSNTYSTVGNGGNGGDAGNGGNGGKGGDVVIFVAENDRKLVKNIVITNAGGSGGSSGRRGSKGRSGEGNYENKGQVIGSVLGLKSGSGGDFGVNGLPGYEGTIEIIVQ